MAPDDRSARTVSAGRGGASVIAVAVFIAVAILWSSGHLERLEFHWADARAQWLQQEADSDIVIVGIDARSLRELREWPWPRRYHAQLLDRLLPTEPARVFVDVDFSAQTQAADDEALEAALSSWHGNPIILPAFFQQATGATSDLSYTRPLPAFERHAELAWMTLQPGRDGLVRSVPGRWHAEGEDLPSLERLVPDTTFSGRHEIHLDFSIRPSSFAYYSYVDVLQGRVLPSELRGKDVYVGATAVELGDTVPVPVYQSLPGVAVLAMAAQTARNGGLRALPRGAYLLILALWSATTALLFARQSWRRNLLALAVCLVLPLAVSFAAYSGYRLEIEGLPLALAAFFGFIITTLKSLNDHTRYLQHQATHDPLTSLPNRTALSRHLKRALADNGQDRVVAVMMLDLCRFKEVNDTLGHEAGDRVLCEVSRRLRDLMGGAGLIARVGGDEFTAVLSAVTDRSRVSDLARRLTEGLKMPIRVDGLTIDLGLSIGVALYPEHGRDGPTLLRQADVAMYMAKRLGRSLVYYDRTQDEHSVRRLTMAGELRRAIATGGIRLHYQPLVNLRTGKAEHVEALLRWDHPTLGAIHPGEFVAVAEATDLIEPLTLWTLEEALQQMSRWRRRGMNARVAVNLSARMLQDTGLAQRLRGLLRANALGPEALELELTESAMMVSPPRAMKILREVHALGVSIAVDDFGTGFSSLQYLRDVPADVLKLDTTFVMNMGESRNDRIIVASTIQMAHALDLRVVAEGVQSAPDVSILSTCGCDFAQGYWYTPALPADECLAWLQDFNAGAEPLTAARA